MLHQYFKDEGVFCLFVGIVLEFVYFLGRIIPVKKISSLRNLKEMLMQYF